MLKSFSRRYRYFVFAAVVLAMPWVAFRAKLALESNSNRIEDWLPASFVELDQLRWFESHFVSDNILMLSWPGCQVDDARLERLAEVLRRPVDFEDEQNVVLFRQITTVGEAISQLESPPLELTRTQALKRLSGWLAGADGKTGAMILTISHVGWKHRHAAIEHIYATVEATEGLDINDVRLAGSTLDAVAIDRASNDRLPAITAISFSVCFILMLVLFRSVYLALIVFLDALICQQLSLALINATGTSMDSVLLMVPCLVYVLTISGAVHLTNYYRDAVIEHGFEGAPIRAIRHAISPCVLASITTGLGLISLMFSLLTPIRTFGLYAAAALVLSTVVLFVLLPCQLDQFPPLRLGKQWRWSAHRTGNTRWQALIGGIAVMSPLILLGSAGLLWFGLSGIAQLRASAKIQNMFSSESRIVRDYGWLEKTIGPLVPVEIVLRIPKVSGELESDTGMLDRLRLVGRVHSQVSQVDGIGSVISALNFAPALPSSRSTSLRQVARRTVINKKLVKNRAAFHDVGLFRETADEELWRISARAFASRDVNFNQVIGDLAEQVPLAVAADPRFRDRNVTAVFCGGIPLVQKAQDQMLLDLVNSFLVAFLFIAAMMIGLMIGASIGEMRGSSPARATRILVDRTIAGLLAMVPNVLPCIVVLGAMGLAQIPVEIGSILTASVALGIAVDDTLHFVTWFRRGTVLGQSRRDAVAYAYAHCGTAMIQTTLICGLGLLVFGISPFMPMARFAWLMFSMLTTALLADLVVLPALLISPLGSFFEPLGRPPVARQEIRGRLAG